MFQTTNQFLFCFDNNAFLSNIVDGWCIQAMKNLVTLVMVIEMGSDCHRLPIGTLW